MFKVCGIIEISEIEFYIFYSVLKGIKTSTNSENRNVSFKKDSVLRVEIISKWWLEIKETARFGKFF